MSGFAGQALRQPCCRHPEIVPHQNDALQPPAVALVQGLHQVRVLFAAHAWSHSCTRSGFSSLLRLFLQEREQRVRDAALGGELFRPLLIVGFRGA